MQHERSQQLFAAAKRLFPGGVNSPVRAFRAVGGQPVFIEYGHGAYLWDVDGNRYIDYVGSWGAAILGHSPAAIIQAVGGAAAKGLSFGASTPLEVEFGTQLSKAVPSLEMMRFVSSGTEACMAVLRLARAYTQREKILKFSGCYHGHADMLLVQAGSGVATFGLPDSPGVPQGATAHTLVAPFNDVAAVERLFAAHPGQIAAVIVEPIVGNAGFIRPQDGFLERLQSLCAREGSLFILDEVMTGFRVAWGGAQALYSLRPDLSTFAKAIGGGMPLALYGGRRDIMEMIAPSGPVYQAGTLSGNPVAVSCGMKTLELLQTKDWATLARLTAKLVKGLSELARKYKFPFIADSEGGMFGFFFHAGPVTSYEVAKAADTERFRKFFGAMLQRGIYLAPSAFEAGFVSFAHTQQDIDQTLTAAEQSFKELD